MRGKRITAPTAGMARGLAAGLGRLEKPYVWGGTNDDGCARGGGALNSCQGQGPGWDCSGLTEYVITQARETPTPAALVRVRHTASSPFGVRSGRVAVRRGRRFGLVPLDRVRW